MSESQKVEPKVASETSMANTVETLSVLLLQCITLLFNIEYDLLAT